MQMIASLRRLDYTTMMKIALSMLIEQTRPADYLIQSALHCFTPATEISMRRSGSSFSLCISANMESTAGRWFGMYTPVWAQASGRGKEFPRAQRPFGIG
jgi:hypothetical protein